MTMSENCTQLQNYEEDGAEDAEGRGPPHGAQAVQVSEMILSPSYDIASI